MMQTITVLFVCLLPVSHGQIARQSQTVSAQKHEASKERALATMLLASAPAHGDASVKTHHTPKSIESRRAVLQKATAAASLVGGVVSPAFADTLPMVEAVEDDYKVDRVGNQLVPKTYTDIYCKMYIPSTWNAFEKTDGYDLRFQDIVQQDSNIQVTSQKTQSAMSVTELGTPEEVAQKLAKGKKILSIRTQNRDGQKKYIFEFEDEDYHTIVALSVYKTKLWKVTGASENKNWKRQRDLMTNAVLSFSPTI